MHVSIISCPVPIKRPEGLSAFQHGLGLLRESGLVDHHLTCHLKSQSAKFDLLFLVPLHLLTLAMPGHGLEQLNW
jgi:hypothetical protein